MAYYTLILLFLINLINYMDRFLVSGALSFIKSDFTLSDGEAGALMTAFLIVFMCASPLFGWLGDRYVRKYLIACGIFLWSLAAGGAFFAKNYLHLMVCRALAGIGESSYVTTAPTVIADLIPTARRGRALAFFYLAIPVGSAMGFMLGGWIGAHWGWRYAFLCSALPGLLLAIMMLTIQEPQRGQSDGTSAHTNLAWKQVAGKLFHNPSFIYITIGMAAMTFAMGGLAHWMPEFLHRCRGIPKDVAGLYFGACTVVTGLLGTFIGGWLGDWYQKRHGGAYFLLCGTSMMLGAPFVLIAFMSESIWMFWTCMFLGEFFLFLNTGPGNTIIINVVSANMRATAFALNTFFIHFLGDAISPTVIGMISDFFVGHGTDASHGLNYSMYIMPVVMVVSSVLFFFGAPHLAKDTEKAISECN